MSNAVKVAISSSKWHAPYSEANGDNFSDVGDDEMTTGALKTSDLKIKPLIYTNMIKFNAKFICLINFYFIKQTIL